MECIDSPDGRVDDAPGVRRGVSLTPRGASPGPPARRNPRLTGAELLQRLEVGDQPAVDERVHEEPDRLGADLEREVLPRAQVKAHRRVGAGADQQRAPGEGAGHGGVDVAAGAREHLGVLCQQPLQGARRSADSAIASIERTPVSTGGWCSASSVGAPAPATSVPASHWSSCSPSSPASLPGRRAVAPDHAKLPASGLKADGRPRRRSHPRTAPAADRGRRGCRVSRAGEGPSSCEDRAGLLVGLGRGHVREVAAQQHRARAAARAPPPRSTARCRRWAAPAPRLARAQMQVAELDQHVRLPGTASGCLAMVLSRRQMMPAGSAATTAAGTGIKRAVADWVDGGAEAVGARHGC